MGEVLRHTNRALAYDWDHRFEPERPVEGTASIDVGLVVLDEAGHPSPLAGKELSSRGLGHIVTTATVPQQRKPAIQEYFPDKDPRDEKPTPSMVPDPSIYLG